MVISTPPQQKLLVSRIGSNLFEIVPSIFFIGPKKNQFQHCTSSVITVRHALILRKEGLSRSYLEQNLVLSVQKKIVFRVLHKCNQNKCA